MKEMTEPGIIGIKIGSNIKQSSNIELNSPIKTSFMTFFGICALCVLCLPLDLDYLTYYKNKNPKDIPKPMPSANLSEVIDEWDVC